MADVFYLAWRYLSHHRWKTAVLVASVALIVSLPLGLRLLVDRSAEHLTARAAATPLLIGAKGSPLELALSSLYFETEPPTTMRYAEVGRVAASGLAEVVPLHTRFRTRGLPIVGTTLDYFRLRGLDLASGRGLAVLGECVLGARAAAESGVDVGGALVSSPESVFDLAGVYPLEMRVVGVLEPSGGPDDRAVFVDLKTAWVIEGLFHGHTDLDDPAAAAGVLRRDGSTVVANASVTEYQKITSDNVASFHVHGDTDAFPVTAAVLFPRDKKASAMLQGRYLGDEELVQIVRPREVIEQLLGTILTVRQYVSAAVVGVGVATFGTMTLVFVLSLQLRRREMETMAKIGAARGRIAAVVAAEILAVLATGVLLAGLAAALMAQFGDLAIRMLVRTA